MPARAVSAAPTSPSAHVVLSPRTIGHNMMQSFFSTLVAAAAVNESNLEEWLAENNNQIMAAWDSLVEQMVRFVTFLESFLLPSDW
jgi:hypothetical protein